MRGRVDLSEGLIRERPTYQTTVNLIQKPDYNTALIKTFRILERSPTPTLGDVIHPVCIVEDLRESIRGTSVRVISAQALVAAIGSYPVLYVRCAPQGPTVLTTLAGTQSQRVIVDRVMIQATAGIQLHFAPCIHIEDIGFQSSMVAESRPAIVAGTSQRGTVPPGTAQPTSGFTAECYTNRATVAASVANGGLEFRQNSGATEVFEGPFELAPDFVCCITTPTAVAGAVTIYTRFFCREFPS